MEGTSYADDMRLLRERIENRFSFPLVRIWFLEAEAILYNRIINVRRILGAIDELYTPVGHQQAVFVSRPDRLTQHFYEHL
jgi:hypothetical protein